MSEMLLTNELIFKSFMFGAKNVIHEKNSLNAINVFPVPDGDTGTNLASMMSSILERSKLGETAEETMQSIADAAIIGARGNSGIIFAQYIYGFSIGVKADQITTDQFIELVENASNQAYQAITKPVEGTMITLMRTFAKTLKSFKTASKNFLELLIKAYEALEAELARTPEMLKILKDNKVVDAGAKGFVHFIDGFIKALRGDEIDLNLDKEETVEALHVDHLEDSQFRYCTEALIKGQNYDFEKIKSELSKFGDSLVVAGSPRTVRVHIHTDHPDHVFTYLDQIGQIAEQKVDDMKRQFEAANHPKYKIALVCDSIADLPSELVEKYQIHMIPLNLLIHDTNYFDKLTIKNDRFYELMDEPGAYPTSAQPNPKMMENFFSFLTTYYQDVLVLTVSKKMSGTYQVLVDAAKKFTKANIKVINSKQNSGAEGLLVLKAAQWIEEGLSLHDVAEKVEETVGKAKILVSVKTLKYMVRAGRVTKTKGLLGKIMNLKPIISIDETGAGMIFEKGLSLKTADKKIFEHIKEIQEK